MKIYTKKGDLGMTSLFGGEVVGKDSLVVRAMGEVDELNACLGVCLSFFEEGCDDGMAEVEDDKGLDGCTGEVGAGERAGDIVYDDVCTKDGNIIVCEILREAQCVLFEIGAELAVGKGGSVDGGEAAWLGMAVQESAGRGDGVEKISARRVEELENHIDEISAKLEELKNFILPGGCGVASHLHLARAVCRRAERAVVGLFGCEGEVVGIKEGPAENIIPYLNRLSDLLFVLARWVNARAKKREYKWLNDKAARK